MNLIHSSVDGEALSAWRGQLAATEARRGLRTQLLQHRQELLPRFAAVYRQLRALPRRLRKALQRRWGLSLAGVALTLALQPLPSEAATFTAGTAAELVTAINTANSTAEADTITLTADITLSATNNMTYASTVNVCQDGVVKSPANKLMTNSPKDDTINAAIARSSSITV